MKFSELSKWIPINLLMEQTAVGILIYRLNSETEIVYSNEAVWRFFNCRTEEAFTDYCGNSYAKLLRGEAEGDVRIDIQRTARQYELLLEKHRIFVRETETTWRGTTIRICFLLDISHAQDTAQLESGLLENMPANVAIFSVSREGDIQTVYRSRRAQRYLGDRKSHPTDVESLLHFVYPADREIVRKSIGLAVKTRSEMNDAFRIVREDGYTTWIRQRITPVPQPDGSCLYYAIYTDESMQKKVEEALLEDNSRLYEEAMRDELTGLYNRRGGERVIRSLLESGDTHNGILVVLDIDHFKDINDQYGHGIGDEILRHLGQEILDNFHKDSVCSRYGGDEFIIFLRNRELVECMPLFENFSQMLHMLWIGKEKYQFTVSCGLVEYPKHDDNYLRLWQKADTALYMVKNSGRRGFVIYYPGMEDTRSSVNLEDISEEMPGAMLVYQADDSEHILYASQGLLRLFECESMGEFMQYTGGSFRNLVHPEEVDEIEEQILKQIIESGEQQIDYVEYHIVTKKGNVRYVEDYSHLVDSAKYGKAYFVVITEKRESYEQERAQFRQERAFMQRKGGFQLPEKRAYQNHNEIVDHFQEALERGYIQVYYQPVVRTINRALCGLEGLARWVDPEKGVLSPCYFIPQLEDAGLIYQLDLHVVRTICRELRTAMDQGDTVVPISFNLSRHDFIACDIFKEVEKIAGEYQIPRDMLNVEITETLMMENPEIVKSAMVAFRRAGYQVWMDDFGSGYSSLNVLKNFEFDEIKLDMSFLMGFDIRSQSIVRSVVAMAKNIGVHTLAEGVETEEQFQFLKMIGCERAQGYLISRPLPLVDCLQLCREKAYMTETRAERDYYDRLMRVDFLTESPMAVYEYDGQRMRYLFYNRAYEKVWKEVGAKNMEEVAERLNCPKYQAGGMLRDFLETLLPGGEFRELDYTSYGQYMRSRAKCIAKLKEKKLCITEASNLTRNPVREALRREEAILYSVHTAYDRVVLLDTKFNSVTVLIKGTESAAIVSDQEIERTPATLIHQLVAKHYIHPAEQKEYLQWAELEHSLSLLKQEASGTVSRYFRTKSPNGAYVWKVHSQIYMAEQESIVYFVGLAPLLEDGLSDRLLINMQRQEENQRMLQSLLWRNLYESKTINFFWKDTERRFLGANQAFLTTYGFESVDRILGKTDEDMHWHIDDMPYQNDEWDVIRKGRVIRNSPGKCIIKGVTYDILATKEPLYENGKIVGLFGYFVKSKDILGLSEREGTILPRDGATGLLSSESLMATLFDYVENWHLHGEDFVIFQLQLLSYYEVIQNYGDEVGNRCLSAVSDILLQVLGTKGNIGRLYGGHFVAVIKQDPQLDLSQALHSLRESIEGIHAVNDFRLDLQTEIEISFASEYRSMQELWGTLFGREV